MLTISGLSKRYGDESALVDVSFSLSPGDVAVLIGRSGAGKTTLLRCINGLETPDDGIVELDEQPLSATSTALVFQEGALVEEKSALENVLDGGLTRESVWRELIGWHASAEKRNAIERMHEVGLAGTADRPVGDLSGGQRQRVGIARAHHQYPSVLLADEPIASLDPDTARSVLRVLSTVIRERNLIGLVSLHQPELATEAADRYLGLDGGRLVLDEPAANVDRKTIAEVYHNDG